MCFDFGSFEAGDVYSDHVLFGVVDFSTDLHRTVSWKSHGVGKELEVWVPREV